jgi:hypothetical protein
MQAPRSTGYSGTPLSKKLGIKEKHRVHLANAPKDYEGLLAPLPPGVVFAKIPDASVDVAQIFVTTREDLEAQLRSLRTCLKPEAALWVSWPKKSSKVSTTITDNTIRELALPMGFVDIKVCAVSEVWSGLKLVVRRD